MQAVPTTPSYVRLATELHFTSCWAEREIDQRLSSIKCGHIGDTAIDYLITTYPSELTDELVTQVALPRRAGRCRSLANPSMMRQLVAPLTLFDLANVMLGVEFKAEPGDEIDLSFKEIDMMLLIAH